jgi:uncharacterized membrane protein YebE (DUF533 family)
VEGVKETATREMKAVRGCRKVAHEAWKKSVKLGYLNYAVLMNWKAKVVKLEGQKKNKREGQQFIDNVEKHGNQVRRSKFFQHLG